MVRGKVTPHARGRGGRRSSVASANPSVAPARATATADCATPSVSPSSSLISAHDTSSAACGTCKFLVGDDAVGCDRCEGWFHPQAMCLGLPQSSIRDIVRLEGEGILFVCLNCRLKVRSPSKGPGPSTNSNNDNNNDTVKQLSEMVMALCSSVKVLTSQMESLQKSVDSLSHTQTSPPPLHHPIPPQHPPTSPDSLRLSIRDEIREMREREKRYKSVIIRGLPNSSIDGVTTSFTNISTALLNREIPITNITPIDQTRGIFRGDILDGGDRRLLLSSTHKLKESATYKNVFIHSDLTYKQRQEYFARRSASGGGRGSGLGPRGVAASVATGGAGSTSTAPGALAGVRPPVARGPAIPPGAPDSDAGNCDSAGDTHTGAVPRRPNVGAPGIGSPSGSLN